MKQMKPFYRILLFILFCSFLGGTPQGAKAQITFKLKSVVGAQNPSSNGLFSYGTGTGAGFTLFPSYGEDGTGNSGPGNCPSQKGWTFQTGVEHYPFLAFEQLNACEITPQPFPPFGIFMHPEVGSPSVVRLSVPNNATILSITSKIQRPSFGCGNSVGYSIVSTNGSILGRQVVQTSNTPSTYSTGSPVSLLAGDAIYFVLDSGDDGSNICDDSAVDVEVTLKYDKIVTPVITGSLSCSGSSATFNIAYQQAGTLTLYQVGNPTPISSVPINQVGNTFNGQATFSGLTLTAGGDFYVIATNANQDSSDPSVLMSVTPCCTNGAANVITVNNPSICAGQVATLTANNCNGTVTWSNGFSGTSTTTLTAGTYTATCTVAPTGTPCVPGISTATGTVTVNPLPTITADKVTCSADLLTYSIDFTSTGTVTSSAGVVSGSSVLTIPAGLDVILTATNANGCTKKVVVTAPSCTCPTIAAPVSGGDKSICQGASIPTLSVLVASGETADWYNASGVLVASTTTTYTPTTYPQGGSFSVQTRNLANACVSATKTTVSLTINPLPTLTINSKTCSTDLLTYSIDFTSTGTVTSTAGTVSGSTVTGILSGTSITLTATSSGNCTITQSVDAPVCSCPLVNAPISGGNKSYCQGTTIPTLSVTVGANEVANWYSAASGGTLLVTATSYTPTAVGTYYVESQHTITGCTSASRTAITVTDNGTSAINLTGTTCSNDLKTYSIAFTADGTVTSTAGTVSGTTVTGIPTGTNVTLTTTSTQGCSATLAVTAPSCVCSTVATPLITADNMSIVLGGSAVIAVANCTGIVTWEDGSTATTRTVTPTQTTSYSATCTTNNGSCVSASGQLIITVTNPPITVSASPAKICKGDQTMLTMIGCPSTVITWTSIAYGTMNGNNFVVTAMLVSDTFTGHCTTTVGERTATVRVEVSTCIEPINVSASPAKICKGDDFVLTMTGCNKGSIYWTGASVGRINKPSPTIFAQTVTDTYTGHCVSKGGEESTATVTVEVGTCLPKIAVSASAPKVCKGDPFTLTMTGCNTGKILWTAPQWSNIVDQANPTVIETVENTYTYTGHCYTKANDVVSASVTVEVGKCLPKIAVSVSAPKVCKGDPFTLTMTGCNTGKQLLWTAPQWSGINTQESPTVIETNEGTYTYTGHCYTKTNDVVSASVVVEVSKCLPVIKVLANPTVICKGENIVLSMSGCTSGKILWTAPSLSGIIDEASPTIFAQTITDTYTGHCYTKTNDVVSASVVVEVKDCKADKPRVESQTVCYADTITLQSGCTTNVSYWWAMSDSEDASVLEKYVAGSPVVYSDYTKIPITATKTYVVYCSNGKKYGESEGVVVTFTPKAKIEAPKVQGINSLVLGDSTTLTAMGCDTTEWKPTTVITTNNQLTVKPIGTRTKYKARCISNGCHSDWTEIEIATRPKVTPDGKPNQTESDTICVNGGILLRATCGKFKTVWLNDTTLSGQSSIFVSPQLDSTYSAVCIDSSGVVSDTTNFRVIVIQKIAKPTLTADKTTIIVGENTTLHAKNCTGTISWEATSTSSLTATKGVDRKVSPIITTTYIATCHVSICWSDTARITVQVRPKQPIIEIVGTGISGTTISDTLCQGKEARLTIANTSDCSNGIIHWVSGGINSMGTTMVQIANETTTYKVYCELTTGERSDSSSVVLLVEKYTITDAIVYPNPTTGKITIKSKGCIDGAVFRVFTLRGEKVLDTAENTSKLEWNINTAVLDLFDLPSEEYILQLVGMDNGKEATIAKRIIKINRP